MCKENVNQIGKESSLNRLKVFLGMKCEVSYNAHTHNNNVMCTYTYENFNYDQGEHILCLFDASDETLNTRIDEDLILEVKNLNEDIYRDVVDIYTKDFIQFPF